MNLVKFFSILVITLAFVLQMAVIVPSGSTYCAESQCGIYFWGAHEHDGVWHLAVSETLFNNFPFQMPNMSGTPMQGYNYLYDIVIAGLAYVTGIGSSIWFFKILPMVWFCTFSYYLYQFALTYRKSKTFVVILWFFAFFGSSLSYLIKMRNGTELWGASSLLSMQSLQAMLNPQFAWSLIPLLLFLIGVNQGKRSYADYLKYGLLVAVAIGLKFYTGVALLIILGADLLLVMLREKKQVAPLILKGLLVGAITALSVIIFYNPGNGAGFPFLWRPFATVNPIIEDKSLFYLSKWAERLYSYSGLKLAILEIGVLSLFIIMNFGSRILGLLGFFAKDRLSHDHTRKLIIIGAISTLLLSILLTQKGVWWNTVQFLYVSLFLVSILAAEGIDLLIRTKRLPAQIMTGLIVILTIPTNLDIVRSFTKFPGTAYINTDEVEALTQLRAMENGVILAPLFGARPNSGNVPELSRTYDTAYISAYSGKPTYLANLIQLELTNMAYEERLEKVSRYDCGILQEVKYIYEYQDRQYLDEFAECGVKLDRIIETKSVSIYLVQR